MWFPLVAASCWLALPPPQPPRTPKGLAPCVRTLATSTPLSRAQGEAVRYLVEVDGVSLGTVDFKVERRGGFEGKSVTEYRSLFKLDALVATFVPVEGRAAAIVVDGDYWPAKAMDRYHLDKDNLEEDLALTADGRGFTVKQVRNGKTTNDKRTFPNPVLDFVTGFYLVRALPREMNGCTIIYGNQRAYTIWIKPDGREKVRTPVGFKDADRYLLKYGSEKSPRPYDAVVWIGDQPARLPYRVRLSGKHTLEAHIHLYENGR
ncbi:MAG: DUF3108 domain-containing protein [Deltaproteobacteria bacterium]|nr:DUF3108 domain-containing protein [Deltaproteobacteria bacterium]